MISLWFSAYNVFYSDYGNLFKYSVESYDKNLDDKQHIAESFFDQVSDESFHSSESYDDCYKGFVEFDRTVSDVSIGDKFSLVNVEIDKELFDQISSSYEKVEALFNEVANPFSNDVFKVKEVVSFVYTTEGWKKDRNVKF